MSLMKLLLLTTKVFQKQKSISVALKYSVRDTNSFIKSKEYFM